MRALLLALVVGASAGVEERIITETNAVRKGLGLPVVREDARLRQAAQEHSEEMLKLKKLSHDSPTKGRETPAKRASAAGFAWRRVGENVAFYEGYRPSGRQVVTDWMNSPPHKANIVDPAYRSIGVATACGGRKCYVTQLFGLEPSAVEKGP